MSASPEGRSKTPGTRTRIVYGGLAFLFAALTVLFYRHDTRSLDDDELARRIQLANVTWPNYEEDIKAIAAAAAAEWEGDLTEVRREGHSVTVTFCLRGPWASRSAAIPILLREARGGIYRHCSAQCGQGVVFYVFELPEDAAATDLPWVEVKYPHATRRIVLSDDGLWKLG